MRGLRILLVTLLMLSAFSANSQKTKEHSSSPSVCSSQPFAYDHGPLGQQTWCGACNDDSVELQAPINIPSDVTGSELPPIQFGNYANPTELVIYPHNPYNLKVDYSGGTSAIKIGSDIFKLKEFHFHRPSEEAIDNHRYPLVAHLVHVKAGCSVGDPGCVAVVTVLIEEGQPTQQTTELLDRLFRHFPPPEGPQGVKITLEGLLPPDSANAGYYSYQGSLTTPPCTGNIRFYVLKPRLKFSAEQIAELAKHYPSPNSRDIQPLHDRKIESRH
jgi:carbonic anhydrase